MLLSRFLDMAINFYLDNESSMMRFYHFIDWSRLLMVRHQLWLVIGLLFLYIPISSAKTHTITEAWVSLSETENQCPDVYDYFPNGGLLSFYCHKKP